MLWEAGGRPPQSGESRERCGCVQQGGKAGRWEALGAATEETDHHARGQRNAAASLLPWEHPRDPWGPEETGIKQEEDEPEACGGDIKLASNPPNGWGTLTL